MATMMVESDINIAPNAGEMVIPQDARSPAAMGMAMKL